MQTDWYRRAEEEARCDVVDLEYLTVELCQMHIRFISQ